MVTPSQPVHTRLGWIEAYRVKKGECVTDGEGKPVPIAEIVEVADYFEVFDLSVDHESHNYAANGLLCHNKEIRRDWENPYKS